MSTNAILGDPARYFDPSSFVPQAAGFYGDLGRNTLIGPGLVKVDCSLNKRFRVTERLGMELRTEAFNLFNHPNLSIPGQRAVFSGVNATTGLGIPVSSARPVWEHIWPADGRRFARFEVIAERRLGEAQPFRFPAA